MKMTKISLFSHHLSKSSNETQDAFVLIKNDTAALVHAVVITN